MFSFRRRVYLDNNATTVVSPVVRKEICRVLKHCYGNPSSLYKAARESAELLSASRKAVAGAMGASPEEVYFIGGASEALNTVIKAVSVLRPGKKIIATALEHSAVTQTLEYLASSGTPVAMCRVGNDGKLDLNGLKTLLSAGDCSLLCCMAANNETGVMQDIPAIAALAHSYGVLLLVDCVQVLGKKRLDVAEMGADYAVISAHKVHGPKGIGALYVRRGAPIMPLIHGGPQEGGLRAGTESVHDIAGFAKACEGIDSMIARSSHLAALKQRLEEGLRALCPEMLLNSPQQDCLPNTLNVVFPGHVNSAIMGLLDCYGVAVSAGSACNTQENAPSHVLLAIGRTPEEARSSIRFSLPDDATGKDVDYTLSTLETYFRGTKRSVSMFTPAQLDENLLLGGDIFILDVRFDYERRGTKGLPGSWEIPFLSFTRHTGRVPKDKFILVVCQAGFNAPLVAYHLRNKGYRHVGFLLAGIVAWKRTCPELYEKYSGRDVRPL